MVRVAPSKLTLADQVTGLFNLNSFVLAHNFRFTIHDFSDCRWWLYSNVWQLHPHIVSGNKIGFSASDLIHSADKRQKLTVLRPDWLFF
jgi:hypothetical protein